MKDVVIFSRVSSKEKVFFARQLAVMISSGLPIDQAIRLVEMQTKNAKFKKVLFNVHKSIEAGEYLSAALNKFPEVFDRVFVAVVKSGEASGKLDKVLTHLADRMENMEAFKSKVRSAVAYPIFVVVAMIGVIILMMVYVIPQLKAVFDEAGVKLPWTTRAVLWVSNTFVHWWWLILIIVVVIFVACFCIFRYTKRGRFWWDIIKLKSPIVRYVSYDIYMARFARTFGMLIAAGIPIIEAIKITAASMNNRVYIRILKFAIAQVERGIPLSVPIEKEKEFPILVSQMVMVGEQTGRLETLMEKLGDYYETEVDTKVKTLANLIEPVTIVIVGLGVAFLAFSVLYPIYGLVQVIQ